MTRRRAMFLGLVAGLAAELLLAACHEGGGQTAPPPNLLVGAHYYLWFPRRFQDGTYLRSKLLPSQKPLLGEYSSASPRVVEQHISWASAAGVDFFALDWWPDAPERNALVDQSYLAAPNLGDIRFCIFYELGALGYDETRGMTPFDEGMVARFLSDMEQIAARYFGHPRYLRVSGRPVIILYVTRTATGRFAEAMSRFRQRMADLGQVPYVIGDEIFWEVAREDGQGRTDTPQPGRIALFDAITAYNLYDSANPRHTGYASASTFLDDSLDLYERYREAAGERPLIPLALPGYNDRALRPQADHYAIPREWASGAGEGTFFAEWLQRFTLPLIDPRLPMMLVTSWNEWSEDTAIEPAAPAPPTAADRSRTGTSYTQGFLYEGYGTRYLETLRARTGR